MLANYFSCIRECWIFRPRADPVPEPDLELGLGDSEIFYLPIGENYVDSAFAERPTLRTVITAHARGYKVFSLIQD